MKAIHADPKEVRRLFQDEYIIPDFQRPYSWTTEECENLWNDLTEFYPQPQTNGERYFLGNIVIHPNGRAFSVIDGQQRLTTLLLLIKALFTRAGTVQPLEKCLKKENPLTGELVNELRVESHVLDTDREQLHDIIFNDGANLTSGKFLANCNLFKEKLRSWLEIRNNDTAQLNALILTLLDQVVLLPIHCDSEDDALTIFETINNRGLPLTDADIFKAKLHSASGEAKDEFLGIWKRIENHEWLFRIYMHVLRAKEGDTSKEIALRTYFTKKNKIIKEDWRSVMQYLETSHSINDSGWGLPAVYSFWSILSTYPNYYWNYPLFVYLHKYGQFEAAQGFVISPDKAADFLTLMKQTVKYYFVKGLVYNSVNAVKDTTFRICASIQQDGKYLAAFQEELNSDIPEFERRLRGGHYGRYVRGLVLLAAILNAAQDTTDFVSVVQGSYHIEHILPKKWNNYDAWTQHTWNANIDRLGNLAPLEWKLNISAQNEFFSRKQTRYSKSGIQDILDLTKLSQWYPADFAAREEASTNRIIDFVTSDSEIT